MSRLRGTPGRKGENLSILYPTFLRESFEYSAALNGAPFTAVATALRGRELYRPVGRPALQAVESR